MARPYVPVLVEGIVGRGPGLASGIALVAGTAALLGAVVSPLGGAIGDRIGFRTVLVAALAGGGLALAGMPFVASLALLAVLSVAFAAFTAAVSAMVFGLLATEVPPERRSTTLNLVYLPLYAAGIIGPAAGSVVAGSVGVSGPFLVGGAVFVLGALAVGFGGAQSMRQAPAAEASAVPREARGARSADSAPD
jgi:MFS family permease